MSTFTDHESLAYISKYKSCVLLVSKYLVRRLGCCRAFVSEYSYRIWNVPWDLNVWRNILHRFVQVPAISMRAMDVHALKPPNDTLLSKKVVRVAPQRALAQDCIRVSDDNSLETSLGAAV